MYNRWHGDIMKFTHLTLLNHTAMFFNLHRPYPTHDSPSVLMVRSGAYYKNLSFVKDWYSSQHDNWYCIDGEKNQWHVWRECQQVALRCALQIQQYLLRVTQGDAHVHCMVIVFALQIQQYLLRVTQGDAHVQYIVWSLGS